VFSRHLQNAAFTSYPLKRDDCPIAGSVVLWFRSYMVISLLRALGIVLALSLQVGCALSYPWERSSASARDALVRRDLASAENFVEQGLFEVREFDDDDPRRIELLGIKAEILRKGNRFEESAKNLKDILALLESQEDADISTFTWSLLTLARVELELGSPEAAIVQLERLLEIDEGEMDVAAHTIGAARGELGGAYAEMKRWADAFEEYQQAAAILTRSGPESLHHRYERAHVRLLRMRGLVGKAQGIADGFKRPEGHYLWGVLVRDRRPHFDDIRYVTHWRRDQMPLRVCIPPPPSGSFPDAHGAVSKIADAMRVWENVVEEGVPTFEFVQNDSACDIPFRWYERLENSTTLALCRRNFSPTGGDFSVRSIDVATKTALGLGARLDVLALTVTHETGHALGLFGHSPSPIDIMYPYLHDIEIGPSSSDVETIRQLYGLEPGTPIRCIPRSGGCELVEH
jgi:tetratricopeptide (TPR) repeat protein